VNGAAAAGIMKWGNSSTLSANDVLAGHWISATFDGTYWQLEGQLGNANAIQINGGTLPTNAKALGTNSSGQPVSTTVAGSGAGLTTGPTSVGASGNVTEFTGTSGQIADSGTALGQVTLLGTAQTMNAAHLHTGNESVLASPASTTSTSLTSTGIVLPGVPASTTVHGTCALIWEGSSTSYTTTFGLGANNAPTDLWVLGTMHGGANGATLADKYTTITNTTATAVTTADTPGAASTGYRADLDFTLQTGSSNPVTVTLYYESSNSSGTSYVEPGSACWWM
jgi:hypothetical protein